LGTASCFSSLHAAMASVFSSAEPPGRGACEPSAAGRATVNITTTTLGRMMGALSPIVPPRSADVYDDRNKTRRERAFIDGAQDAVSACRTAKPRARALVVELEGRSPSDNFGTATGLCERLRRLFHWDSCVDRLGRAAPGAKDRRNNGPLRVSRMRVRRARHW
jgi:hypothetical protein